MDQTKLIGLPPRETPTGLRTTGGHRRALPPDLLRQASRRLEILCLVAAALWVLGPALGHVALALTDPGNPRWVQFGATETICTAGFLMSLGLFVYIRVRKPDPAF